MTPALTDIEIFMPHSAVECYSHSGSNFFPVTNQCERYAEIMGDDYVRLSFSLYDNVFFDAFAHINYDGEDFFLEDDYSPNYDNGVYVYDLKFVSIGNLLKKHFIIHEVPAPNIVECVDWNDVKDKRDENVQDCFERYTEEYAVRVLLKMRYHNNQNNAYYKLNRLVLTDEFTHEKVVIWDLVETTVSNVYEYNFSITSKLGELLLLVIDSIRNYDCPQYLRDKLDTIVATYDNTPASERQKFYKESPDLYTFTFDGTDLFSALSEIANSYDTEWYIECNRNNGTYALYIKTYELSNEPLEVSDVVVPNDGADSRLVRYKTKGLLSVNYKDQKETLPNVIYPSGSDRNMTPEQTTGYLDGKVFEYNKFLKLEPNTTYVVKDADGNDVTISTNESSGIVLNDVHSGTEERITFDSIYPRCYYQITEVEETETTSHQFKYEIKAVALDGSMQPMTEEEMEALGLFPKRNVTDGQAGQTPTIIFESGILNGMEFEVAIVSNHDAEHQGLWMKIVPEMGREDGEGESKIKYPQGSFIPMVGDNFSLVNIKMPDGYIVKARDELAQAAYDYYVEKTKSAKSLSCVGDPKFFNTEMVRLGRKTDIFSRIIGNNSGFKFDDMFLHPNVLNIKEFFNSIHNLFGYKTLSDYNRQIRLYPVYGTIGGSPYIRPIISSNYQIKVHEGLNAISFNAGLNGMSLNTPPNNYIVCSRGKFVLSKKPAGNGLFTETINEQLYYRVENITHESEQYYVRTPNFRDLTTDDNLYNASGTYADTILEVQCNSDLDFIVNANGCTIGNVSKRINGLRYEITFNASGVTDNSYVTLSIEGINGISTDNSERYIIMMYIKAEMLKDGENPTAWCPMLEDIQHNKSHVVKIQHKLTTPQEVSFETATIRKIGYLESNRIKINSLFNQQKNK